MCLMKWRSNNRDVNKFTEGKHENIEESSEDTSYASLMLNPDEKSENKALGIPNRSLLLAFKFKNPLKML